MQKEIQINIFNETSSWQDAKFVNKDALIYYLENNFEDIKHLNIVREFAKHLPKEETANPFSYPQECTTIEKENIDGVINTIEFCPFNIQTRELTQEEKDLIHTEIKENEVVVYIDGKYQKICDYK